MRRNLAISSTAASINTDSFNNTVTFSINDSVLFAQENANSKYTENSSYFSSGVTSISFHWNYARFSLSRNVVISISAVSTAVARNKMAAVVASLGITGGWASVLTYGTVFIASWLSTNLIGLYPNGMFIDFNYFGLAGCGIGYIVGGFFGIAATITINLLAPLRPNVCGVTVGHQEF